MVKLEEIRELHNIEPNYAFSKLQQNLPESVESKIQDSRLYKAIKTLTEKAYPTEMTDYDKRWLDFYVPLKRKGYFILVPMAVILSEERFFLSFSRSNVEVCKGKEKNEFYLGLIEQTLEFSRILKKDPGILAKTIPYDIRTGRVLGKYVLKDLIPEDQELLSADQVGEMLKLYRAHVERETRSRRVSLDDYLNTAALCYKAAFGSRTDGLSAEQMYKSWADGRDCGMLEIKNKRSKKDFSHWLDYKSRCGGHPFEIVYSQAGHGIHLLPPYTENPHYVLKVTDYSYAMRFLEMCKVLIRTGIPFKAHKLEAVLDYLSGQSYFTVNAYAEHDISYGPGYRNLLRHIIWDEPKIVKWKRAFRD